MKNIKIGIIGPNKSGCSDSLYQFGIDLGKHLATSNRVFFSGGAGGFMEAVSKGVKSADATYFGQTVGILQGDTSKEANSYIDIAIPTGIGIARNIIIVNTADIIIAASGGAGTLSEIAFAWQKKKTVLCITQYGGWTKELAGTHLDHRNEGLLIPVKSIEEITNSLSKFEQQL